MVPDGVASRVVFVAALAAFAGGCALGRPHVKSLRDREAGRIALNTVHETTVTALNGIHAQCGPALDHRRRAEEFTVYQVVARITRVRRKTDHDIHIVLEDPVDVRQHMIVELDDPDFRGNLGSPFRDKLIGARRTFDALAGPGGLDQLNGALVRVTGVGFFDVSHFQIGRSRSCLELHPILAIERVEP